jgi:Ca2+/Na+ antiporter
MDPQEIGALGGWIGLVGGVVGSLIGLAGGVFGTYCSIRNCRGPRERAFMVKASIVCWVFVLTFLAALLFIPTWHKHLLWIPYAIVLVWGIRRLNERHLQIRQEESAPTPG